jgi:putative toxin-antitoxin system antitoxin component (TIGR02293 family)
MDMVFELYRDTRSLPASEPVRLGRLLGLGAESRHSALALADRLAAGLPVAAVDGLAPILRRIGSEAMYRIISEPTLRRARKANALLNREHSERLYEFGRVVDQAARIFHGDIDAVVRFLSRPNPVLDGRTPFEVACLSSAGAELVADLLRSTDAGVAV